MKFKSMYLFLFLLSATTLFSQSEHKGSPAPMDYILGDWNIAYQDLGSEKTKPHGTAFGRRIFGNNIELRAIQVDGDTAIIGFTYTNIGASMLFLDKNALPELYEWTQTDGKTNVFWNGQNDSDRKTQFSVLPLTDSTFAIDVEIGTDMPEGGRLLFTKKEASKVDEALIKKTGADEYGMKKYVMAFLKRGPNRSQSPEEADRLQRAHLDNIFRLAEEGKLVVAGPFLDDGDVRGIYIFNVETVEEAKALTETDPAIQTGRLEMELHPWYGSAALVLLREFEEKLAKYKP